jgi:hypothetical protein
MSFYDIAMPVLLVLVAVALIAVLGLSAVLTIVWLIKSIAWVWSW